MTTAPLMLGVSGLRGITGQSLTHDVATRYAAAFGMWLRDRVQGDPIIVVGRDGRQGGTDVAGAAIAGLRSAGCRVTNVDVAMTPTVGVAVDHIGAQAGMIVTASHNPQQWNGLKCLLADEAELQRASVSAAAPPAQLAAEIIERFGATTSQPDHDGTMDTWRGAGDQHVETLQRALDESGTRTRDVRFTVVLDSVNASGGVASADLLAGLGADLVHLNNDDSGIFPHPPEPVAAHLGELCGVVTESGADVGFAQDPDADRLAIVDEHGTYIGEEYTLALCAESVLSAVDATNRILCTNLSTSRMLEDVAARHGATVVRTAVGEANVVEAMKTRDAVLGGEGNGGVIWPRVTYVRDSLSAIALVLSLMARTGKTVSELVADINSLCGSPTGYAIEKRKVDIPSKDAAAPACAAVHEHFGAQPGATLDDQDGVRVDFADEKAWLHVRASNTEPIMRLIAESPSAQRAAALLDEAQRIIG